ncbi:MAG: cytochrome c maturation protein CcmE [Ignavibacteriaceae bacterium]|jgi:cytochrome c-type biogenesis protein CcmE|nr:cytochrome c maturation protein CcmE [Ignavibacteriaceae bacterium]
MKNKYIFGGVIIVVFLGLMMYLFTQSNIEYVDDFNKVMSTEKIVKATGSWVKEKNYQIDNQNKTFAFMMTDVNGNQMKVIYEGTIPNNFESATSVVVTGKYQNGYFHAKDILTKCPSKYEEKTANSSL